MTDLEYSKAYVLSILGVAKKYLREACTKNPSRLIWPLSHAMEFIYFPVGIQERDELTQAGLAKSGKVVSKHSDADWKLFQGIDWQMGKRDYTIDDDWVIISVQSSGMTRLVS